MPEAEEAHQRSVEELERIESLNSTLDRTIRFLEAARERVQRFIAPRLARAIQARIAEVTGRRYAEATVDPETLEVKVRSAGGAWRSGALPSHGTAEQIYLLLRVALAEFLVTTGETAPLIMDDVMVQSDSDRTAALLDLLLEVSQDRQVILLSQEQEVLGWASRQLDGDPGRNRVTELDASTIPAYAINGA